jgi:hypothetical protein
MLAAALTLIFVLFFHDASDRPASTSTALLSQASYIPQPVATPPTGTSTPHLVTSSATATPTAPAVANSSPNTSSSAGPVAQGKPVPVTRAPKVQTANLSLATPSASQPRPDGLDSALAGRGYSGLLRVNGFSVPLPAGTWLMLANTSFKLPTATGEMIYLGQIKNKRLVGAIRITAGRSLDRPGAGFKAAPGCNDHQTDNNYVMSEEVIPNGHQACWIIGFEVTTPLQQWADRAVALPSLDRAAAGDMAAKGVTYPQDLVDLRFTRAETWGLLEVKYFFSPEAAGIKSNDVISLRDSDWFVDNISRYPEKQAYVDKLKQWGSQFWPRFKSAFDEGQLGK